MKSQQTDFVWKKKRLLKKSIESRISIISIFYIQYFLLTVVAVVETTFEVVVLEAGLPTIIFDEVVRTSSSFPGGSTT